ncbi:MAG TPA: hypothetical protein VMT81_01860 [Candidatus Paceibacterota bacterium]|nr:hypothetical protein [Candidatus Paceibacterota bacterium]
MKKIHIIWAIIAVAALAGGFFWGKSVGSAAVASRAGGRFALGSSTAGFAGRAGAAGGLITGQVSAIDGDSITLQLANGNSEVVFYSSSTPVVMPQPASISSVTPGTDIIVTGTQNSDGSVTASGIQVRNGAGNAPMVRS